MNARAKAGRRSTLVGLIGSGISGTRTPAMHEAEAARLGHPLVYRPLDTAQMGESPPSLESLLSFAVHFGFSGLNITYPYKQMVLPLLDEVSDVARALNAVNTVVIRGGHLSGYNTDYWGFRESFQSEMRGALRNNVLQIGAGGAGSAVAQAMMDVGVGHLGIADTDPAAAEVLVSRLCAQFGNDRAGIVTNVDDAVPAMDGVINASPVGMANTPGTPIPVDWLQAHQWVVDIVYLPLETVFLKGAKERGCAAVNGSGMAIHQAARAFEHFTGLDPDPHQMRHTFERMGM